MLSTERLVTAFVHGLYAFFVAIAVYKGFSEINADALYQPFVQAILQFFGALGIAKGAASLTKKNGDAP